MFHTLFSENSTLKTGLITSICLGFLSACGGDSRPADSLPVNLLPPPPPPPVSQSESTIIGPISGFGSVIVNGIRYNTDNTSFIIDDRNGTQSDLQVGYIITLKTRIGNGNERQASSIRYEATVEGPVAELDIINESLSVLGQTILTNTETSFDSRFTPTSFSGLNIGDRIEVSGDFNAEGDIIASRIELARDNELGSETYKVHGHIANLDTDSFNFQIRNLLIAYGNARLEGFDANGLANGLPVEVNGTDFLSDGALIALQVENEQDEIRQRRGEDDEEGEITGLITRLISENQFNIGDIGILTNEATSYRNGLASDLVLNARIEVEGQFNDDGHLLARHIKFFRESEIEVASTVEAIGEDNLSVLGQRFLVTDTTRFEDHDDAPERIFNLLSLNVGDYVEVTGYSNGTDLVAIKIERERGSENDDDDNDGRGDESEITGPVEAIGTDNRFTLLGITILTDANTEFELGRRETITAEEFFSSLSVGDLVETEGTQIDETTFLAEEVELEERHNENDDDNN